VTYITVDPKTLLNTPWGFGAIYRSSVFHHDK